MEYQDNDLPQLEALAYDRHVSRGLIGFSFGSGFGFVFAIRPPGSSHTW